MTPAQATGPTGKPFANTSSGEYNQGLELASEADCDVRPCPRRALPTKPSQDKNQQQAPKANALFKQPGLPAFRQQIKPYFMAISPEIGWFDCSFDQGFELLYFLNVYGGKDSTKSILTGGHLMNCHHMRLLPVFNVPLCVEMNQNKLVLGKKFPAERHICKRKGSSNGNVGMRRSSQCKKISDTRWLASKSMPEKKRVCIPSICGKAFAAWGHAYECLTQLACAKATTHVTARGASAQSTNRSIWRNPAPSPWITAMTFVLSGR